MANSESLPTETEFVAACAVVVWSDVLGGVLTGEEPLPWSGPLLPHQISGGRREAGQAPQQGLLSRNVRSL